MGVATLLVELVQCLFLIGLGPNVFSGSTYYGRSRVLGIYPALASSSVWNVYRQERGVEELQATWTENEGCKLHISHSLLRFIPIRSNVQSLRLFLPAP